jgi:hypothetical protein
MPRCALPSTAARAEADKHECCCQQGLENAHVDRLGDASTRQAHSCRTSAQAILHPFHTSPHRAHHVCATTGYETLRECFIYLCPSCCTQRSHCIELEEADAHRPLWPRSPCLDSPKHASHHTPSPRTVTCHAMQGHSGILAVADDDGFLTIINTASSSLVSALRNGPDRPLAQWQAHENSIFDVAWTKVGPGGAWTCQMRCTGTTADKSPPLPKCPPHQPARLHRHT